MADTGNDNWLEAAVVPCPRCGVRLFVALHSPFCDDYRLYCDACPAAVEVGLYDDTLVRIVATLPAGYDYDALVAAVEPRLAPCACGGRYRGRAPRRCLACHAVVPAAAGKDVFPATASHATDREPTDAEWDEYARFETRFVWPKDLWRPDGAPT